MRRAGRGGKLLHQPPRVPLDAQHVLNYIEMRLANNGISPVDHQNANGYTRQQARALFRGFHPGPGLSRSSRSSEES